MFGGGGGFVGGGYGGYGGVAPAGPDGGLDRVGGFGAGVGGSTEASGFNAFPSGGNFGGEEGYGAATNMQASQGLGGYLRTGQGGGQSLPLAENAEGQRPNNPGPQREQQSLMPLTIRMLVDAHERGRQNNEQMGQDAALQVNGREISMFTFVGCLESVCTEVIYKVFQISDGTARTTVKKYKDTDTPQDQELQIGEYVRVFGSSRVWGGELNISAYNVRRVESPNEVPYHFIEVAHVHLASRGMIQKKAQPSSTVQGSMPPNVGQPSLAPSMPSGPMGFPGAPGAFGGAHPAAPAFNGGMQAQGGGAPQGSFGTAPPAVPSGFGGQPGGAGPAGGAPCFKCGQTGHWARECPNAGGGGAGSAGGGACHKCGQTGHWARECPNAGGGLGGAGQMQQRGMPLSGMSNAGQRAPLGMGGAMVPQQQQQPQQQQALFHPF